MNFLREYRPSPVPYILNRIAVQRADQTVGQTADLTSDQAAGSKRLPNSRTFSRPIAD
jgi:hypothetical protein